MSKPPQEQLAKGKYKDLNALDVPDPEHWEDGPPTRSSRTPRPLPGSLVRLSAALTQAGKRPEGSRPQSRQSVKESASRIEKRSRTPAAHRLQWLVFRTEAPVLGDAGVPKSPPSSSSHPFDGKYGFSLHGGIRRFPEQRHAPDGLPIPASLMPA